MIEEYIISANGKELEIDGPVEISSDYESSRISQYIMVSVTISPESVEFFDALESSSCGHADITVKVRKKRTDVVEILKHGTYEQDMTFSCLFGSLSYSVSAKKSIAELSLIVVDRKIIW